MDVSGSMRATDVEPNRLVAAQDAAKAFVAERRASTRVGVVAFAGTATLVQAPTDNREDVDRRDRPLPAAARHRHRQRPHRVARDDLPGRRHRRRTALFGRERRATRRSARRARPGPKKDFKPVPPGSYNSAVIILLTDGQRTTGPDPIEAAKHGRRPRRARLHRRLRHHRGRDHRLRGLVDARAPRRGDAQDDRRHDARRVLLRRHRGRPEEGLPRRSTRGSSWRRRRPRSPRSFSGVAALLALLSGLLSLLWFNRIL